MKPFVSHDGQGAEVRVSISTGVVKSIDLNEDRGFAQITFNVENLKFPPKAWTNMREDAFKLLTDAKEAGANLDFRIESQRKANVAVDTPIEELLANEPGKNVRSILAGVRYNSTEWSYTSEAVTDPIDDPTPGGRVSAMGQRKKASSEAPSGGTTLSSDDTLARLNEAVNSESFTDAVIATLTAEALLAGASIETVHQTVAGKDRRERDQPPTRASIAAEAPAWKDWNSDGRPNLGRLDVIATVTVERFVREQLGKLNGHAEESWVAFYTRLLLALADRVQGAAYGDGFRADRSASSHSTIRGIIYDSVDRYESLPVPAGATQQEVDSWVAALDELVTRRFNTAIAAADERYTLADLHIPGSSNQTPNTVAAASAAPPAQPVETLTSTAEPVTEDELAAPAPTPQVNDNEEAAIEPDPTDIFGDDDDEDPTTSDAPVRYQYPDGEIDDSILDEDGNIDPAIAPTAETQEEFKRLAREAELDRDGLRKLVLLLEQTFGTRFGKIANIPDDALGEMIDFYAATGVDNFRQVVESVV